MAARERNKTAAIIRAHEARPGKQITEIHEDAKSSVVKGDDEITGALINRREIVRQE